MGGYGSGRQSTKRTTSSFLRLDIQTLKRDGMLTPGRTSRVYWLRRGSEIASIKVRAEGSRVVIAYRSEIRNGEWQEKEYPVQIERTDCNLGGQRVWFWCPDCGRRVAVLYGREVFTCRHCRNLAYASQRETDNDRAIRRADNIREKLGWGIGIANPEGGKPKGMHWKTYWHLRDRYNALVYKTMAGTLAFLHRKR
ncbi:MAG: hypothetical protein IPJ50_11980 [Betaproteobacteria bacterium]|jgi:hypothetical protein|nr:hypothetical protein [Betaproteobacteria bacterium]